MSSRPPERGRKRQLPRRSAHPDGRTTYTIQESSLAAGASSGDTWRTSTDANASGGALAF